MKFFKGKRKYLEDYSLKFKVEIDQLKDLGYYDFQIKDIFASMAVKKRVKNLSELEIDEIRRILQQHIQFAQKALKVNSKDKSNQ